MAVTCEIKYYNDVKKKLEAMKKAPKKVLDRVESDIKTRGPGWIAKGVVERYNLEGSAAKGRKAILDGDVGNLKIKGSLTDGLSLVYSGRQLTPVHFGMKPTIRPEMGTPYTLKWQVLKETTKPVNVKIKKLTKKQRKNIGRNLTGQGIRTSERSPWMLQPTGTNNPDKVPYIPFQRTKSTGRKMYHVARTVSLPQMVTQGKDGPMHPASKKYFNEGLSKRLDHHMKLLEK